MKIKQIEIKDFGSIYRQTIAFSPDMNVLYTEKERTRREIQAFIEYAVWKDGCSLCRGTLV